MSNTTVTITQLPPIGNAFTASTVLPVVQTTGVVSTDQAFLGDMANYILTQAGANLQPAYVANFAYAVTNAAQPMITSLGNLTRLVVTGPAVLQNVDLGNLTINGGNNGQFLQTNGNGVLNWSTAPGAGTGSPGGANTQLQYNLNGSFAGDVHLTWDSSNAKLNTTNINASGNVTATYFIGSGSHLTDLNSGSTIVNGDSNVNVPVSNGNVYINTNAGTAYQWEFDTTGNLTLPGNTFAIKYANGTQVHLTSNSLVNGSYALTLENDGSLLATDNGTPSNFVVNNATPDVDLRNQNGTGSFTTGGSEYTIRVAGTPNWVFDSSGNLTVPGNIVHHVSQPDSHANLNIDSWNPINLNVGDAMENASWSFNYDGTLSFPGSFATIYSDTGSNQLNINAGGDGGGYVTINATTDTGIGGSQNVTILTNFGGSGNSKIWNFDNTGNLTVPIDSIIKPADGSTGITTSDGNTYIDVDPSGFYIYTAYNTSEYQWFFDDTGNLTLPGNIFSINYANGQQVPLGGGGGNNAVGVGSFGSDLGIGANYNQNDPAVLFSADDMLIRTGGTANAAYQNNGQIDIAASEQLYIGLADNLVDATNVPSYKSSVQFPYGGTTVNVVAGTNYLTVDATTGLTYNGSPIGPSIGNFVFPNPTSNTSTISVSDGSDIVINPTYGGASPAYINVPGSINGPTSEALQIYNGYFVGNASAAAISIGADVFHGITIFGDGSVVGNANITANYFIGDGSQLSNLPSSGNVGNFAFDSLDLDGTTFDEVTLTGTNSGNIIVNAPGLAMVIGGYESGGMVSDGSNTYLFNGDPTFVNGIPQPGVGYTWQFDNTGNTILPGAIVGNGNLKLQPDVNTGGAYLDVYLTGGPDIHIAGNGETVILGSDAGANVSVQGAGNVAIQANSVFGGTPYTWMFDYNSNLTLPQLTTINDVSGNGTTLTVGVPPTVIVISGADFSAVNTTYTRDFGQATPTWYPAGYTPGIDSYIMFTGGQYGIYNPGFVPPIYVNTGTLNRPLTQWSLNPPLGSIAPTAVYTYGFTGPAWKFDPTGNLKLPGVLIAQASDNGSIVFSNNGTDNNGSLKVDGGLNMTVSANSNFYVKRAGSDRLAITDTNTDLMASSNVVIHANKAGSEQNWTFGTDGKLTTPGDIDMFGGVISFHQQVGNITWGTSYMAFSQYGRVELNTNLYANANIIGANVLNSNSVVVSGNANVSGNLILSSTTQIVSTPSSNGNITLDPDGTGIVNIIGNVAANYIISPSGSNGNITLDPDGTGVVNVIGNVVANNFSGNISITGNVQGTSPNVTLVAGSYSATFDNTGVLTLPAQGIGPSNEGAEIDFTKAPNSSLSGNAVIVDQYIDRIRFFEGGGSARGAYIDLSQAAAGVNTLLNNRVSGLVNAGTFVTMDNIKATVTSSGNRGLSLAAVSTSFNATYGANYAVSGGAGGSSSNGSTNITTTPSGSVFGWNFTGAGDISTYIITDTTNNRAYRITLQIGGGYNNNMISIERLV